MEVLTKAVDCGHLTLGGEALYQSVLSVSHEMAEPVGAYRMKPIDVIRDVKLKANGQWQNILSNLGAEVPLNTHTACPSCGGKDRFRFDDKDDNFTFICSQCGSGDGLDLVQRVLGCSVTEAAYEVAGMI